MKLQNEGEESGSNDRWLNSFANLMMLLFALFVVLFASSKADVKKLELVAQSLQQALDSKAKTPPPAASTPTNEGSGAKVDMTSAELQAGLASVVDAIFREANPSSRGPQTWVEFEELADGAFLLRISPEGLFRPGETRVEEDLRPLLDRLGELIRKSSRRLKIEGHADYEDSEILTHEKSTRAAKNTWELSALRGAWVAQYWMRKFDFDPAKMEVLAFGKYRPLPTGGASKHVNQRRIEVVIEKKD